MECSTPSSAPQRSVEVTGDHREVLLNGHVEFQDVGRVGEFPRHSLRQAQPPAGAGEHDLGPLLLGQLGHAEGEGVIGEDSGDEQALAF